MRHKAPAKLWIANGGKTLVADGHPEACALFSREGQDHDEQTLSRFSNWQEAFGLVRVKSAPAEQVPTEDAPASTENESADSEPAAEADDQPKADKPAKKRSR